MSLIVLMVSVRDVSLIVLNMVSVRDVSLIVLMVSVDAVKQH